MLTIILIVLLVLLPLSGLLPQWPYTAGWSGHGRYGPSCLIALILIVAMMLILASLGLS